MEDVWVLYGIFMTSVAGLAGAFYALVIQDERQKERDQEAYFAFHEREREKFLVMRVVDDVRRHYGSQQAYEIWRFRWRWDGSERFYWKSGEKFYQLNGKEGPEDFTEDDVNLNAYDIEVFTVKFVKGPSRWEITTQSDGKTVVRMIG